MADPVRDAPAEGSEYAHRFPCPSCGADLRFDPGSADGGGQLLCGHCGYVRQLDDDPAEPAPAAGPWGAAAPAAAPEAIAERDFRAALREHPDAAPMEVTRVLKCQSCGAQVEVDEAVHGTTCPFCASAVVGGTGAHRHIKPGAVLPFAMDERSARRAMKAWLGRLWFAPSGLARYARSGRAMSGIYTPYWTFDARTATRYAGERGTVYYVQRSVIRNGKRQTVREPRIRWQPVRGRVARAFDDILVLASRALPARFAEGLPPWDLSQLQPYAPEYLAGMRAEAYTVELEEGFGTARAIMDGVIARDVRFDIGGDRQRITGLDTEVADVTFKHVLLPIWVAAYKYRGRSYRIVVNGQTGRVQGERPWSAWKIALAVLAALLVAAALGFAIAVAEGEVPGFAALAVARTSV